MKLNSPAKVGLLKVGTWSSQTAFSAFCLKDISHRFLGVFTIGPVVQVKRSHVVHKTLQPLVQSHPGLFSVILRTDSLDPMSIAWMLCSLPCISYLIDQGVDGSPWLVYDRAPLFLYTVLLLYRAIVTILLHGEELGLSE